MKFKLKFYYFTVVIGVRQGGTLSPQIFKNYMDERKVNSRPNKSYHAPAKTRFVLEAITVFNSVFNNCIIHRYFCYK